MELSPKVLLPLPVIQEGHQLGPGAPVAEWVHLKGWPAQSASQSLDLGQCGSPSPHSLSSHRCSARLTMFGSPSP